MEVTGDLALLVLKIEEAKEVWNLRRSRKGKSVMSGITRIEVWKRLTRALSSYLNGKPLEPV